MNVQKTVSDKAIDVEAGYPTSELIEVIIRSWSGT